jgi:DNA-binding CsgD family transcriptional regulator
VDGEVLTQREREVLQLLADGYTNREVAALLHVSLRTAEFHRANIQEKLQVRGRAELTWYARSAT